MSVDVHRFRRVHTNPLAAVLLVGAIARALTAAPVWGDEAITLRIVAQHSPAGIVTAVATNQPHLPTYYLVVEALSVLPGSTIIAARLLSVVASLVTIDLVYRLGTRWFDDTTALLGALLVALSPLHAIQGTWVRMYPLFGMLAVASWLALEHVRTGDASGYAYLATTLGAVYLHPYGLFLIAAEGVWLFGTVRKWRPPALAALASTPAALYLGMKAVASWGPASGVRHITAPPTWVEVALAPLATLSGSVVLDGQLLGLVVVAVASLAASTAELRTPGVGAVAVWVAVPLALATGLSYLVQPIFMFKYLGFLAPAVALFVAHRCRSADSFARVALGLLVVLQVLILWLAVSTDGYTLARTITYGGVV